MHETRFHRSKNLHPRSATDESWDLLLKAFLLLSAVSIVFAAVPEADLVFARLFWQSSSGFQLQNSTALIVFRDFDVALCWVVVSFCAVLLISTSPSDGLDHRPAPHKLLYVMTFFALGPGLSAHLIKAFVGRARPNALEEFGGSALFTPAWHFTDQCVSDCSFISGEAASAFALLTLVVFVKPKYSIPYLIVTNLLAASISVAAVASGAHFLSDVLISWPVMLVIAVLLWRSFSRRASKIDALFGDR